MVALAILGVGLTGGSQVGYASLIDLDSGRVLWFNRIARSTARPLDRRPARGRRCGRNHPGAAERLPGRQMTRQQWLAAGCAHCVGLFSGMTRADADLRPSLPEVEPNWATSKRFDHPEVSTDEGGLWAMLDREETRLRRSPFLMRDEGLRDYLQGIACKLGAAHCADIPSTRFAPRSSMAASHRTT